MAALWLLAGGFRDLSLITRVWPGAVPGQKRRRSPEARPKVLTAELPDTAAE
jgi:hypothetical protein